MQGYREASPPHVDVKLGPLPLGVIHFIVPVLIGLVGLFIAGCVVQSAVRGPVPGALRCSRAADVVTCEEWKGTPLVLTQRSSGPHGSVRYHRTPGKNSQTCVELGNVLMCGGSTRDNVARIAALTPGQTIELDATNHDPTNLIVGSMFALLVLALAGAYVAGSLARRNVVTVRLTPTTLEVIDRKSGRALTTLTRGPREEVRVVQIRSGRGEGPKFEVAYGDAPPLTAITSFGANDLDLEPVAAALRTGLAELPPPVRP
jgi:hypothetical protein